MNIVVLVGMVQNIVAREKVTYLTIMVHGMNGNEFIDVMCFGQTAEFVKKWFRKGKWITIRGRISRSNYNDEWKTEIIASRVGFCGNKENTEQYNGADYTVIAEKNKNNESDGFIDITDDVNELPWELD